MADEPTGNLDKKTSNEIMNLLVNRKNEYDMTLVSVTHSAKIAAMADRRVIMEDGKSQAATISGFYEFNTDNFFDTEVFKIANETDSFQEELVYLRQKKLIEAERFLTIPIKGIADSDLYGQSLLNPVIILSEEYYKKNLINDFEWGSTIDVTLEEDWKLSDIADNIKILGYFGSMDYLASSRTSMEANELIIGLLYVIVILAALIGFIIIMCTIMIEWEISQKEYAILKSIGATTRKVQYVILTEKAVICLASCISGVFFGIIMERVLMKAAIKGNALPLNIPVAEIFMAIAVMLGVTAVSTIIQSWSLKKMNLSEVMNKSI